VTVPAISGCCCKEHMFGDFLQEFSPCTTKIFSRLEARVKAGSKPADHFSALMTAADLLKRTVVDRQLKAARKSIVLASPFLESVADVPDEHLVCCRPRSLLWPHTATVAPVATHSGRPCGHTPLLYSSTLHLYVLQHGAATQVWNHAFSRGVATA
jgi:hypothetical protein